MKIRLIIICLGLMVTSHLYSQDDTLSPKYFEANISNIQKSEILLDSSRNNLRKNNEQALFFAEEGLKYAKKSKSSTHISKAYRGIGEVYRIMNKGEEALIYYDKALDLIKEKGSIEVVYDLLKMKGHISASEGNFDRAIEFHKENKEYVEALKDTILMGNCFLDIGVLYARKDQYYVAVDYFFKSLELYEAVGYDRYIPAILNNIGAIYQDTKDYDKALVYLRKAKDKYEEVGNSEKSIVYLLLNLGITSKNLELYDEALEYYNQALEKAIVLEEDAESLVAQTQNVKGQLYLAQGKSEEALNFTKEALSFFRKENAKDDIAECLLRMATIYREKGNISLALKYAKESKEINIALNKLGGLVNDYQELALINKELGNSKDAFKYLQQYVELRDSVFDADKREEFVQLEAKYSYEQEELQLTSEINLLKKDKRIQTSRQITLVFALASILIALLALFWVFNNNKKKTVLLEKDLENKAVIEEQAQQLQVFNTQLEKTVAKRTAELEQANYELRTFNYIASHDIKEPIRVIGNYAGLIFRKLPNNLKTDLGEYFTTIKASTKQLYTLIEDFARYTTLSKDETIERNSVDLNLLVSGVEDNLKESIEKYNGEVLKVDLPVIESNNSLLFSTLKNLIENGLKYNESKKSMVKVSYHKTAENHEITVSDNGIGIDKSYHDKIFEMFKRLHTRDKYTGSGIGLAIVKLNIDKLKGQVRLESEEGKGSQFIISLPL
jgi:signal transduction histidine kinase